MTASQGTFNADPGVPFSGGSDPTNINYMSPSGTTELSLKDLFDKMWFSPESYGAEANGVHDDRAAIILCHAAANFVGGVTRFTPGKTYYVSDGFTLTGHVDGDRATISCPTDFNGTLITVGDGTNYVTGKRIAFPKITNPHSNFTNWDAVANSIGILLLNVENCEFRFGGVSGFANGIWVTANSTGANHGTCYNEYLLGAMIDNKIGVRIRCLTSGAWVNENHFYGGRFQLSSSYGTNPMFTRHVLIETWATAGAVTTGAITITVDAAAKTITRNAGGSGDFTADGLYAGAWTTIAGTVSNNKVVQIESLTATVITLRATTTGLVNEGPKAGVTLSADGAPFSNIPNQNNFNGTSFEGAVEAFYEIRGGLNNNFIACRFEPVSGQGYLFHSGMGSLASCKFNNVIGGYSNGGGDFIVKNGPYSYTNTGFYSERLAKSATSAYGWLQYANYGSDTYPLFTIWPSSVGEGILFKPTGANWHLQCGGYYMDGKAAASGLPMLRFAWQTGRAYFGDGTTALSTFLTCYGANLGYKQVATSGMGGGFAHAVLEAVSGTLSGASSTITINIPTGARLRAVQLRVDTAVTSGTGTTWSAAFSGGSTTSIATGQAFAKSTKTNAMLAGTESTTNTTQIVITPNTGTFTGGVIRANVYYDYLDTLASAP